MVEKLPKMWKECHERAKLQILALPKRVKSVYEQNGKLLRC